MVDKVYKDKCEAWVDGDVDGELVSVFIKKKLFRRINAY